MVKRTLYFGNPAYLSLRLDQLVIRIPSPEPTISKDVCEVKTIPVEDIGVVVLDNKQITITQGLLEALLENNVAVLTCDSSRLPVGLMLPLCGHTLQNERFTSQIEASLPLKKQLWQQTVRQKILNQASTLYYATGERYNNMLAWAEDVRSGDSENMEARAAAYYWKTIFKDPFFVRGREESPPNNILNYGYSILRSIVARSLVSSGLLPTLGIHHHNRYNAYCLADDIMEPYRPYVDREVVDIVSKYGKGELTADIKKRLLSIPVIDVSIDGHKSPLMVAASVTTASLAKCYAGEIRKIVYPQML